MNVSGGDPLSLLQKADPGSAWWSQVYGVAPRFHSAIGLLIKYGSRPSQSVLAMDSGAFKGAPPISKYLLEQTHERGLERGITFEASYQFVKT